MRQGSCCSTVRAEAKALETGGGLPVEDRGTAQVGGLEQIHVRLRLSKKMRRKYREPVLAGGRLDGCKE